MMNIVRQRRQQGQSLVEFGLVLFVLLGLILGAINLVQVEMAGYTATQAARAAAHRAAITGGDVAQARQAAAEVLNAGLGTSADNATITVTCDSPCERYSTVVVEITYSDELWAPFTLPMVGGMSDFEHSVEARRLTELDGATAGLPEAQPDPAAGGLPGAGLPGGGSLPGGGTLPGDGLPGGGISIPGLPGELQ